MSHSCEVWRKRDLAIGVSVQSSVIARCDALVVMRVSHRVGINSVIDWGHISDNLIR